MLRKLMACAMILGWPAASAQAVSAPNPTSTNGGENASAVSTIRLLPAATQVGRDQRFRTDFGFQYDEPYVAAVIGGRSLDQEIRQPYGAFLTPNEAASMDYRMALNSAIQSPLFQRYLHSASDFAGIWVDQRAGGIIHLNFTGNLQRHASEARAIFAFPDALRVDGARHASGSLVALMNRITADRPLWAARGLSIRLVQENVVANTVVIEVSEASPLFVGELQSAYGMDVSVRSDAQPELTGAYGTCSISGAGPKCGFIDAPPYAGGQEIDEYNAQALVIYICTSGFTVHRPQFPLGDRYWMLTAGHCYNSVGPVVGSNWEQVFVHMGSVDQSSSSSNFDGMTVATNGGSTAVAPRVLRGVSRSETGGFDGYYDVIHTQQAQDADYVGEPTCQAGITSTFTCGTETIHSENLCIPGAQCYFYLREASEGSISGDSGGPNYDSSGAAIGTTTGRDDYGGGVSHIIFQHIFDTTSAMNVQVLLG